MIRKFLIASAAFSALIVSTSAFAQAAPEEEESGIKDIVVTAQRRSESVQDVPIAISAFSSEQLEAQGITNTFQLGQYIPNLFALNNTGLGSANGYYLRGLGNTESIATFDPPVGTYLDDIYLSRQNANNLSFFDVERVEVLRGPQGTLFGRNTTGGAINVIMRDPGDKFGGYSEIGYGRFDRRLVRASVDLPIADMLKVKISGFLQNDDGYVKNVTTGQRINDDDGGGLRLGIKIDDGGSVKWRGSVAYIESNAENILNFECNPANAADCGGRFVTTGFVSARTRPTSPFAPLAISGRKANFGQGNRTQNTITTSNLEFGLGENAKLNLITGFVNLKQQFALDFFDGRGGPNINVPNPAVRGFSRGGFTITNDGVHKQFTQEIKLGGSLADDKLQYVGGFFYIKERNKTDFADIFSISPTFALLLADRTLRNTAEAYAGYFQADYNFSDQFKLTAGIRYTDETKTFLVNDNRASCNDGTIEANCLDNANLRAGNGVAIPTKQSAKLWTPRVALNYKPNEDMLVFLSATRGFKSGGWNARGAAASQLLPFDPEKVWSYEAGIKSDLFDRRVRANLTLYYQDTSDLQTPSALVAANGAITFITRNFADYVNKGAELELTFQPVDDLNLFFNMGYQDDKYKINRSAPTTDRFGIQSVSAQQATCLAQRAAGQIPAAPNTAAAGQPVNNAPACGAGIIAADGSIATPVRTPKISLAVGGSYKMPLGGSGLSLTPSVNASYAAKSETGTSNVNIFTGSITGSNGTFQSNPFGGDFITGSQSKAHWLVNAGLTLKGADDAWALGLECSNCLGESYIQSSLSNYSYLNRPSEWMIRAKFKY
jgi:iron complex outermembrane recepter protein